MNTLFSQLRVKKLLYDSDIQKIMHCNIEETEYIAHAIFQPLDGEFLKLLIKDGFEYCEEEGVQYLIHKINKETLLSKAIERGEINLEKSDFLFKSMKVRIKEYQNIPFKILKNLIQIDNISISKSGNIKISPMFQLANEKREVYLSEVLLDLSTLLEMLYINNPIIDNKNDLVSPIIKEVIDMGKNTEFISLQQWIEKVDQIVFINDSEKVLDDGKKEKTNVSFLNVKGWIVIASIFILIILLISFGVSQLFKKTDEVPKTSLSLETDRQNDNVENVLEDKNIGDVEVTSMESETVSSDETINSFVSDKMKNASELVASIDSSVYYNGSQSLKYENDGTENEVLFAEVNFNQEKYEYLKTKDIDISFWTNSTKEQSVDLIVKIFSGEDLIGKTNKKIFITANIWGLNTLNLRLGDGDRIEIYLKVKEKSTIWMDDISLNISK